MNKLFRTCVDKEKAGLAAKLMGFQRDFIQILLNFIDEHSDSTKRKASDVLEYCNNDLLGYVVREEGSLKEDNKIAFIFTYCLDKGRFDLAYRLYDIDEDFLRDITRSYWKKNNSNIHQLLKFMRHADLCDDELMMFIVDTPYEEKGDRYYFCYGLHKLQEIHEIVKDRDLYYRIWALYDKDLQNVKGQKFRLKNGQWTLRVCSDYGSPAEGPEGYVNGIGGNPDDGRAYWRISYFEYDGTFVLQNEAKDYVGAERDSSGARIRVGGGELRQYVKFCNDGIQGYGVFIKQSDVKLFWGLGKTRTHKTWKKVIDHYKTVGHGEN